MKGYLKLGWLSPDGELYECGSYDHVSEASKIIKRFDLNDVDTDFKKIPHDDLLLNKSWVYIGISCFGKHEWRIIWNKFLTQYQKDFLKPYFDNIIPVNAVARCKWEREVEDM